MSIAKWGPPIWSFLHTFVEKIKDEASFQVIKNELMHLIVKICKNLPCPVCSQHSAEWLSRVQFSNIKSQTDLKNLLFMFHNFVNKSKNKPLLQIDCLEKYQNNNFIDTYNQFISTYHTKGNFSLLSESFQRKLLISDLKFWIRKNIKYFRL